MEPSLSQIHFIFQDIRLTLSNLKVQATMKKENCMATVMMAQRARLLVSLSQMIIPTIANTEHY